MSIARWASARLRWASCCYPLALRCRLPRPKWLRGPTAAQEPHCFESRSPRQPNAPRFRHRRLRRNRYGIAAIGAGAERDMYGCRGTISNARSPTPTGSPVTGNRRPTAGRGSKAVGARDAAARGTLAAGSRGRSALRRCLPSQPTAGTMAIQLWIFCHACSAAGGSLSIWFRNRASAQIC